MSTKFCRPGVAWQKSNRLRQVSSACKKCQDNVVNPNGLKLAKHLKSGLRNNAAKGRTLPRMSSAARIVKGTVPVRCHHDLLRKMAQLQKVLLNRKAVAVPIKTYTVEEERMIEQ